jgi:pimeloyl-ACP methyl ester carboxylesterase
MDISDYADVVMTCLLKLKITNPILVGHSFGGKTNIHIASENNAINKVVLLCSA